MEPEYRKQPKGFATKAIHVGQDPEQWNSYCVIPPIVTSTTFKQNGPAEHRGFEYARSGNPTRNVLEKCLASLDNAKHGLCFSSGLGATTCILSMFNSGDHIAVSDDVYGGTNRLMRQVTSRLNLEPTFFDPTNLEELKSSIRPNTKMVWIETPTNPLLKVVDIKAVSDYVHNYKPEIVVVVDNTFLTSYFQRPLEWGADMVVYSLTKYMNGHSDVVMGAAVTNDDNLHTRLRFLQNATGIVPSPFDCYLVNRGLKTLALRMEQHQKNSVDVAKWLEKHPLIEKVIHPGLPSHPQYELTRRQCYGHSGIMSFYLVGDLQKSKKFLQSLKLFTLAESLGGYESLAELPCVMTHASVPAEDRKILGISDTLLRLSVGLEEAEDLIADLDQALKSIS
ncbi:cystathionine gamma-lyase [Condylostylus longicornis]|uniref:cystathionine gamma-lyase n=1 Tax=Condylostylus longicornis TaxID=2530218 RepID=UPI00244DA8E8|nr:cystathionine gamma-lyase [Condylostylus longicornis]